MVVREEWRGLATWLEWGYVGRRQDGKKAVGFKMECAPARETLTARRPKEPLAVETQSTAPPNLNTEKKRKGSTPHEQGCHMLPFPCRPQRLLPPPLPDCHTGPPSQLSSAKSRKRCSRTPVRRVAVAGLRARALQQMNIGSAGRPATGLVLSLSHWLARSDHEKPVG